MVVQREREGWEVGSFFCILFFATFALLGMAVTTTAVEEDYGLIVTIVSLTLMGCSILFNLLSTV